MPLTLIIESEKPEDRGTVKPRYKDTEIVPKN